MGPIHLYIADSKLDFFFISFCAHCTFTTADPGYTENFKNFAFTKSFWFFFRQTLVVSLFFCCFLSSLVHWRTVWVCCVRRRLCISSNLQSRHEQCFLLRKQKRQVVRYNTRTRENWKAKEVRVFRSFFFVARWGRAYYVLGVRCVYCSCVHSMFLLPIHLVHRWYRFWITFFRINLITVQWKSSKTRHIPILFSLSLSHTLCLSHFFRDLVFVFPSLRSHIASNELLECIIMVADLRLGYHQILL